MGLAERPVAVTMGDPAGIGPEIVLKTFADPAFALPAVVVGDATILTRDAKHLGLDVEIRTINDMKEAMLTPGTVDVLSVSDLPEDLPCGVVDARAGAAAYCYIEQATAMALIGSVSAIVTAPINKSSLKVAGVTFPGHTEILAALTQTEDYAMMLCNDELRVILVTIHLALRDAIESLTIERELRTIRLAARAVEGLGIKQPARAILAFLKPMRFHSLWAQALSLLQWATRVMSTPAASKR